MNGYAAQLLLSSAQWDNGKVKVKFIYKVHLKTTHVDQSAVQLNRNKISNQIENRNKTIRSP